MIALIALGLLVLFDLAAIKWGKDETYKNGWAISH